MKRSSYEYRRRGASQSHTALGKLINKGRALKMAAALWLLVAWCSLHGQPVPESALSTASRSAAAMKIYQLRQGEVAASVVITADGLPLPVSQCYVSAYPYNRRWPGHQRWLDISNDREGVTWCSLDTPLFEYGDLTANLDTGWGNDGPWIKKLTPSSTVYSWAMNNHWITNFPLTQDGPVTFRYRILPHRAYAAAAANRFGLEQAQPLAHVAADRNPKLNPLVGVDNDRVCVTILKPTADGKASIVRLRSLSDQPEPVNLAFPAGASKSVRVCPIEETAGEPVAGTVSLLPHGLLTLRVEFN